MRSPLQLCGIGLRGGHMDEFLKQQPKVAWVEVHSENYFQDVQGLHELEVVRQHYPISLHGVNLSLGSTDELNWQHLQELHQLIERINPCLVSDHLAWTSLEGQYFHELLPLPYTEDAITHVVNRIQQIQEFLQRQILIENISSYVQYPQAEYAEWEFLINVAKKAGCGILLDINNIYVNSVNLNFDPFNYVRQLQGEYIQEIHLGGFTSVEIEGKTVLIDSHDQAIVPAVWSLYKYVIKQFGIKPTLIEWDKDLPELSTLYLEAYRAEQVLQEHRLCHY
jgi:hypothetical protein